MAAAELLCPPSRALDANGDPYSGAKWYFYATGTTTPQSVYTTSVLNVAHANPVIADGGGKLPNIYFDATLAYRGVCKNADDSVTLHDIDPINNTALFAASFGAGMIGYSSSTVYADATVGNELVPRVTLAALPAVSAKAFKLAFVHDSGREGTFICRAGSIPVTDTLQGIYVDSNTANFYWERVWDKVNGKPEWFGAVINSQGSASATLAALEASVSLCPVTLLEAGKYYIDETWTIATENRTVRGTSRFNRNASAGSQIVVTTAGTDAIMVGYASQPSGAPEQDAFGAGFLKDVTLEDFTIVRDTAPSPWSDITNPASVGAGLRVKYVLKCNFRRLQVANHALGVYAGGTIYTKFDDVEARIDGVNTNGDYDTNRGWYLDGTVSFGYAGGNASLYMNRCVGVAGRRDGGTVSGQEPIGLLMKGGCVDTFISEFEVAGTSKGIILDATGAGTFQTVDIHILHPVIDQYDHTGIELGTINQAAIELTNPYVAWNGSGTDGILISSGSGVTIMGGQVIGGAGLAMSSVSNSVVMGLKLRECSSPVQLTDCDSVKVVVQCNNRSAAATQAVNMTNCARCKVEPYVIAASAAPTNFTYGINLASGNTNCTLDVTGVANTATSDRIRTGGGGGSGITTQGDVSGHVIINPGAGAML